MQVVVDVLLLLIKMLMLKVSRVGESRMICPRGISGEDRWQVDQEGGRGSRGWEGSTYMPGDSDGQQRDGGWGVWECGRVGVGMGNKREGGGGGGQGGRRRVSRVPVPGNRAPWGRLNPGLARTKRATGGLGGGFWKRNAKVYRGWVPCNQDSGTQAGHGRWAVGSGRWRGSSSAQPQPWALTPPVSRKSREFIGVAGPQTHGQTRHRPRRLDSTRPSLPRVAVSPVVLTAPLQ